MTDSISRQDLLDFCKKEQDEAWRKHATVKKRYPHATEEKLQELRDLCSTVASEAETFAAFVKIMPSIEVKK